MSIQQNTYALEISGGLDTKSDRKDVESPYLLAADNCIYEERGKLKKRNGYVDSEPNHTSIHVATRRARTKDELVSLSSGALHTYSDVFDEYIERGKYCAGNIRVRSELTDGSSFSQVQSALSANGIRAVTWSDGDSVYLAFYENERQSLLTDIKEYSSGQRPVVVANGNNITLFYYYDFGGASQINYQSFDCGSLSDISAAVSATSTGLEDVDTSNPAFNAISYDGNIYLAYHSDSADEFKVSKRTTSGSAISTVTVSTAPASQDTIQGFGLLAIPDTALLYVGYTSNGGNNYISLDLNDLADSTTTINSWGVSSTRVTLADLSDGVALLHENIDIAEAGNGRTRIFIRRLSDNAGTFIDDAIIASEAFSYNSRTYLWVRSISTIQKTYFLYDITDGASNTGNVFMVGKALYAEAALDADILTPAKVLDQGEGRFVCSLLRLRQLATDTDDPDTTNAFSDPRMSRVEVDFTEPIGSADVNGTLYLSGAQLWQYDGQQVHEQGFHAYPEGVTVDGSSMTGTGNTYQYLVVYYRLDAQGNRSISTGVTVSLADKGAITTSNGPTLTIPYLAHTADPNAAIAVYRTVANADTTAGAAFYRVSSPDTADTGTNGYLANVNVFDTNDEVEFTDEITDAALLDNEILYLSSGELDHVASPGSAMVWYAGRRLWVPSADGNALYYSLLRNEGEAIEFNDTLRVNIPGTGEITGVVEHNASILVFREGSIHLITGEGPGNFGFGTGEFRVQPLAAETGCRFKNAYTKYPRGVLFWGQNGPSEVLHNLSVRWVGQGAEHFVEAGSVITGCTIYPTDDYVIFLTETDYAAVYHYGQGAWTQFTNHGGNSIVDYDGLLVYTRPNGKIFHMDRSVYTDAGNAITKRVQTPFWVASAQQNYQRVYALLLLGEYLGDHTLTVRVYYDYSYDYDEYAVDPGAQMTLPNIYGAGVYGDGVYGGSGSNAFNIDLRPRRQRCQAVSFEILDNNAKNAAYSLTDVKVHGGFLSGRPSLRAAQKFGTRS